MPAGGLIEELIRTRSGTNYRHAPEEMDELDGGNAVSEPEPAVYLGSLIKHFGHFLLEILPRLWVFDETPIRRAYFHPWRDKVEGAPAFIEQAVRLAGGDVEVRMIEGPMVFERLIVPAPLYVINHGGGRGFTGWCADFADKAAAAAPAPPQTGERIYLSRSKLKPGKRKADNEDVAEAFFAARGFTIVHPQQHAFPVQVAMMRGCRVLAGCDGSALHLAMFMPPRGKVIALDSRCLVNQHSLELLFDHESTHFLVLEEFNDVDLHLDEAQFAKLAPEIDKALAEDRSGRSAKRRGAPITLAGEVQDILPK